MAYRIKPILSNIVNYEQAAFVQGRYIGESIRTISDVIYYTSKSYIDGILFVAVFAAAFDCLNHTFILQVLEKFGFGDYFVK